VLVKRMGIGLQGSNERCLCFCAASARSNLTVAGMLAYRTFEIVGHALLVLVSSLVPTYWNIQGIERLLYPRGFYRIKFPIQAIRQFEDLLGAGVGKNTSRCHQLITHFRTGLHSVLYRYINSNIGWVTHCSVLS
jgi:hypothetical protein